MYTVTGFSEINQKDMTQEFEELYDAFEFLDDCTWMDMKVWKLITTKGDNHEISL